MRIIDRHLTALFLRQLALTLATLTGLYGLIEFIERVDDFIEHEAALVHYLYYPLYKLPLMVTQALPLAILLAAFATVGGLSRTQQVTALRSSGVSFWQTTRPLFACGLLFSLAMLAGNSWVVPWSNREARYILNTKVAREQVAEQEVTRDLYLRDRQRILSVAQSYPQRGEIRGITLLELDLHFNLKRRLEAVSADNAGGNRWLLHTVTDRQFDPDSRQLVEVSKRDQLLVDLGRTPEELSEIWIEPAELPLPHLAQLGERLTRDGQDPRRYLAEMHFRIAQSLTPLLAVLLGVPFALQRGRRATLGAGVALTVAVFGGYLLLQAVGMALGSIGLLPIPLAAWAANLLLILIGIWLFLRTEE
jgi:lipopolysaccharide export system permease protein